MRSAGILLDTAMVSKSRRDRCIGALRGALDREAELQALLPLLSTIFLATRAGYAWRRSRRSGAASRSIRTRRHSGKLPACEVPGLMRTWRRSMEGPLPAMPAPVSAGVSLCAGAHLKHQPNRCDNPPLPYYVTAAHYRSSFLPASSPPTSSKPAPASWTDSSGGPGCRCIWRVGPARLGLPRASLQRSVLVASSFSYRRSRWSARRCRPG